MTNQHTMRLRGKTFKGDFAELSRAYCAERDASGLGGSKFREGRIMDARGNLVARISYNGRVWSPEPWQPASAPLYDNR